jgi:hypothetical protein
MTSKVGVRRPSPAMIVAVAALIAAVAGTAIATPLAVKSVLSKPEKKQIKRISSNQANRAISNRAPGLSVANAANAALLDGVDSSGFYAYGSSIPSGTTVQGAFGYQDVNDGTGAVGAFSSESVSFPVPAPDPLTDAEVGFTPAAAAIAANDDEDANCTGTTDNPTAPPGKVCVYPTTTTGIAADSADATQLAGTGSGGSRFGFGVDSSATGGASSAANFHGVWAYTAP